MYFILDLNHGYEKQKNSLESSLKQVLFKVELEFPKILVPSLHQNKSIVKTECVKKSKQLYSLCDQLFASLIYY